MGFLNPDNMCRIAEGKSEYSHRFGGSAAHKFDASRFPDLLLHCIYMLDTKDPLMPEIVPNCSMLPLYYGMLNDGFEMAYQVVNDSEILIHEADGYLDLDLFEERDWPCPYEVIPEERVKVVSLNAEERRAVQYFVECSEDSTLAAPTADDQKLLNSINYPFTQIGGEHVLEQGQPTGLCANPQCNSMNVDVFAVVWNKPTSNFCLWGKWGTYVQIVYELCGDCHTIHVCNRCS